MFRADVNDLGLCSGRQPASPKPSYRPAVERLEERLTLSTAPVHVDPTVTASILQLSALLQKHGNKLALTVGLLKSADFLGAQSLIRLGSLTDRRVDIGNNLIKATNSIISSVTSEQMSDPNFAQAVNSLYANAERLRNRIIRAIRVADAIHGEVFPNRPAAGHHHSGMLPDIST